MKKRQRLLLAAGTTGLVTFFAGASAAAQLPASYEEAKRIASERGVPVLVDFYTDW